jgi:hypothetical protein
VLVDFTYIKKKYNTFPHDRIKQHNCRLKLINPKLIPNPVVYVTTMHSSHSNPIAALNLPKQALSCSKCVQVAAEDPVKIVQTSNLMHNSKLNGIVQLCLIKLILIAIY